MSAAPTRAAGAFLLLAAAATAACRDPRQRRLEEGVRFARITIGAVGRNPAATVSYRSLIDQGGTLRDFLLIGKPGGPDNFCCEMERPTHAWSVVVRSGAAPGEFILEGYGDELAAPELTGRATMPYLAAPAGGGS